MTRSRRPVPARRTVIDVAAVALCALALVWRIHVIASTPRQVLAPRVVQLMYDRMLAQRIQAYARSYGRPAFYLDSVQAHLAGEDAKEFAELRTDLWGNDLRYGWNWCGFTLTTRAGAPLSTRATLAMNPPWRPFGPRGWVEEEYPWPTEVLARIGHRTSCYGGG